MKEKTSHKEWLFFLDKFTSWEFTNKFSLLIINVVDFYREISTKGNICFGKIVKGIAGGIAWFHDAVTSHLVFSPGYSPRQCLCLRLDHQSSVHLHLPNVWLPKSQFQTLISSWRHTQLLLGFYLRDFNILPLPVFLGFWISLPLLSNALLPLSISSVLLEVNQLTTDCPGKISQDPTKSVNVDTTTLEFEGLSCLLSYSEISTVSRNCLADEIGNNFIEETAVNFEWWTGFWQK